MPNPVRRVYYTHYKCLQHVSFGLIEVDYTAYNKRAMYRNIQWPDYGKYWAFKELRKSGYIEFPMKEGRWKVTLTQEGKKMMKEWGERFESEEVAEASIRIRQDDSYGAGDRLFTEARR